MQEEWIEFAVGLSARGDGPPAARADCALVGEARGALRPPGEPLQTLLRDMDARPPDDAGLTRIGELLFELLFDEPLRALYLRCKALLGQRGMRLLLNIPPELPELAALPWELLCEPGAGPLALFDASVVRYLPQSAPLPLLRAELPLQVLLTCASPAPAPALEQTFAAIREVLAGLEQRGLARVVAEPHLSAQIVQQRLRQGFHIWHFVGAVAAEQLLLEGPQGAAPLGLTQLAVLLNRSGVRLAVLERCGDVPPHPAAPDRLAAALVRAHIPAVITTRFRAPEQVAGRFAGELYGGLAQGLPIDACVSEGRKAVMGASGPGQPDWSSPRVFLRAADSRLIDLRAAPAPRQARRPLRVFLSYRRHTPLDEPLARQLHAAFSQAGHHAFIDQTLQVGVAWAAEIQRQIEQSDAFVVLLSRESVQSEMLAREVELAAQLFRQSGRARLLPVRVANTDALPYPLAPHLDALQYARWDAEADTPALIAQLLDALDAQQALPVVPAQPAAPAPAALFPGPAPLPSADPRFLEQLPIPGGSVRLNSPFYVERDADQQLQAELLRAEGTTTTIRAPRQCGKTSLLIRGVAQARRQGARLVLLDLQALEEQYFASIDTFLRYVATLVLMRLRLDPALAEQAWRGPLGASDKLTYLLEDQVLAASQTPIVLAIDEADRLLKTSFHNDVFGLLRFWHNSRALNPLWEQLDILMVISTEPHLLISDVTQSPFNVGSRLTLDDFSPAQVADLNQRYRAPLPARDLPELVELLGGHPYLTSKALYTLSTERMGWAELRDTAADPRGPFGDHLRRYLWLLNDQPHLREALRLIAARGRCPDELLFYRLMQAGLVSGADAQACRYRCRLYELYLRDKLL